MEDKYTWIPFYEEFATKLYEYKYKRDELQDILRNIPKKYPNRKINGRGKSEWTQTERDILGDDVDPFTIFNMFNRRGIKEKIELITILNKEFDVLKDEEDLPVDFIGIPVTNHTWIRFYGHQDEPNKKEIINILWDYFEAVIELDNNKSDKTETRFKDVYDKILDTTDMKIYTTFVLFWIRPKIFVSLDSKNREYLKPEGQNNRIGDEIAKIITDKTPSAEDYLLICEGIKKACKKNEYGYSSIVELSAKAEIEAKSKKKLSSKKSSSSPKISKSDIDIVKHSKNIILYGPPGTGKTRMAGIIADNIAGRSKARKKIIQFHPTYSYEDFVRGVSATPTKKGKMEYNVESQIFEEFANTANKDPNNNYVLIIDEINRANVSTVFGELLYALEYRGSGIESQYKKNGRKGSKNSRDLRRIVVPENLYVIGTMNTADRSLQTLDYAIRRRFSFIKEPSEKPNLKPRGNKNEINKGQFQYFEIEENDKGEKYFLDEIYSKVQHDVEISCAKDVKAEDIMPGISYFIVREAGNQPDWEHAEYKIQYELIPLLKEYAKDGMFTKMRKLDSINETLIECLIDCDDYESYLKKLCDS